MTTAAAKAMDKLRDEDGPVAAANESTAEAEAQANAAPPIPPEQSIIVSEFGNAPIAIGHFVSVVGFAELPDTLSFEDYTEMLKGVGLYKGASMWMAGDLLVYGAGKWPDAYAQVADLTGYDPGNLEIAQGLAKAFPYETRHMKLSWTHHQAVKSLSPEEREEWLCKAEDEGMTRKQLREAIRVAKGRPKAGPGRPRREGSTREPRKPDEKAIVNLVERLDTELKGVVKLTASFQNEAQALLDGLELTGGTSPAAAHKVATAASKLREKAEYLVKDLGSLERHANTVAEYTPPKVKDPNKKRLATKETAKAKTKKAEAPAVA